MSYMAEGTFHLFRPHPSLSDHILYYNLVFPEQGLFSVDYTLMPDACGTLSLAFDGNSVQGELWGASVTPTVLGTEPNRYKMLLLIQFSPYGLYQMTSQNQVCFADKRMLLRDIDTSLYHLLDHAFRSSRNPAELVRACEKALFRRTEQIIVSDTLLQATRNVSDACGQIRVSELAECVNYSARQLNRLFLMQVGVNVKQYIRLVRFNCVLKCMQDVRPYFAAVSQQAGYFDQAHLDKDFKAISGVTPSEYCKKMSHFYYDAAGTLSTLEPKE